MTPRTGKGAGHRMASGARTRSGAEGARDRGALGPPARWRVLSDPPLPGSFNMAVDEALARELAPGEGVLRLYEWGRPTISFGRNEPARGLYDALAAEREGIDFVRRPTGGRAVLHDREITYAVVAPLRAWGGLRRAYRTINEGIVAGLAELGAEVELAGPPEDGEAPLTAGPCFQLPAEGEVTADGRKLVGSAQARVRDALLQHGSLILSGSQDALARVGPEAAAEAGARPATVADLLGRRPSRDELEDALVEGLRGALGGGWRSGVRTDAEERRAEALNERFSSPGWTWRR